MTTRTFCDFLDVETIGTVTVAHFRQRTILAVDAIEAVGDRLLALIHEQGARNLVLDFNRVESLTSSMLGKFMTLAHEVDAAGGRLVFCHVDPFLRQIFEICHLPKEIAIYPDQAAAVAALEV